MGSTDDLEEYDSELELALKREYATVFPLFRYCVITQEATYLCNKLKMDCVPNASYLLFEISMEDVWVWDRNRPTRIIPRAHVFTTTDVTVEQLKEDADADLAGALPTGVLDQMRAQLDDDVAELVRARDQPDDVAVDAAAEAAADGSGDEGDAGGDDAPDPGSTGAAG